MQENKQQSAHTSYLEAQDDSLLMRPMKDWASEKLDYLERYLDIFITAMRNKHWRALNYIDLFAGPGKCRHEDNDEVYLGSPLLALTAKYAFDHYFFVDLDIDNIQALKQRCQYSPYAMRIRYFQEDCNVAVNRITSKIRRVNRRNPNDRRSCLNLAFLDPEGLELEWNTVKALAQLRTDLIIHYSQNGIQRNLSKFADVPEETIMDRFFGTRKWRNIYHQEGVRARVYDKLISLYKSNLRDLGYVEIKEEGRMPMMRNTKNAPLYALIFASKHPLGEKFWYEVTQRDVHGQRRLF